MPKKQVLVGETGAPTGVVKFLFEDESVQEINLNDLSEEIKFRLMVHGASQKIGDSYAGAAKEASPVAFAKESVDATIKQLIAGDWRVAAVGGPRVTDLATAYSLAAGETLEAAIELVGGLTEEQAKEMRAKPRIKAQLALIAAKRAQERAEKAVKDAAEADAKEAAEKAAA